MNNFSIIKNSEICTMSCLKTAVKNVSGRDVTLDEALELRLDENKVGKVTESVTTIKNISSKTIDVNQLSSAFVRIDNKGVLPWYDKRKYSVYFCQNTWLGEGQWVKADLDHLGLYGLYDNHKQQNFVSFGGYGSFATGKYYPLVMIEDMENGETHYFEILTSGPWYLQICIEYNERDEECIHIFTSGQCEKNDHWHKYLKPDESLTSTTTIYGCAKGGFEEAVWELTEYKRKTSQVSFDKKYPPVCFNDYMNCCWAMPTYDKEKALIDMAAEVGVEIFCADSGWQASLLNDDERFIGDWAVAKNKYAPHSFEELIEYANSKGIRFGAWLEIEGVAEGTRAHNELKDYMLKRRGNDIGNVRCFFDFKKKFVQDKIESVFDMLYDKGVRYIKNDYNQTIGIGCDGEDSLSEGIVENTNEFLALIDRVKTKYPDLIIENCGSGSQRCGHHTLKHFELQSTSDQEVYHYNPGIINGALAYLAPEKAGIWAYPYPVRFDDRMEGKIYPDDYSDGKQTIFNMVNSMLGLVYLSGRIDACDELNKSLIKEGIKVYKSYREDIPNSYPIYPGGLFRMSDTGIKSCGLYVPDKNIAYLAVWKIRCNENSALIDMSKYGNISKVDKMYPSLEEYSVTQDGNNLKVTLPSGNSAIFIKITY